MATLLQGELIEVKHFCFSQDQLSVNVIHYLVDLLVGVWTDTHLANVLFDSASPEYSALMVAGAAYVGTSVQMMTPVVLAGGDSAGKIAVPGIGGGDMLPKQICGLIAKRTQLAGRSGRGRLYIPFPGEGSSDLVGRPTAGYVVTAISLADEILATNTYGDGLDEITLSPQLCPRPVALVTAKPITSTIVRARWATQRRRGDFGAANVNPF